MEILKAPFPWFGGKSRVAPMVWEGLGDVDNYIEPFAGSLAVLLGRPHAPKIETVNDLDYFVANFWRAMTTDPDAVARHADWPVNEVDLYSRHQWLVNVGRDAMRDGMEADPNWFDARIAGWWVWGQCCWIGSGWCSDRGVGKRQRPHLGDAGHGVNRASLQDNAAEEPALYNYMRALGKRLRSVRVCCGDWRRVVSRGAMATGKTVGVFLDPPYGAEAKRTTKLYSTDSLKVSRSVLDWCIVNSENPRIRIVVAGYEDEYADTLKKWRCVPWVAPRAYATAAGGGINAENRGKERLWFSPSCLEPSGDQTTSG